MEILCTLFAVWQIGSSIFSSCLPPASSVKENCFIIGTASVPAEDGFVVKTLD